MDPMPDVGSDGLAPASSADADTKAILEVLQRLATALRDRDVDGFTTLYAADAWIADLAPPLARRGQDRAEFDAWLQTWDGPVSLDTRLLRLSIGGATAFCASLMRMRGRRTDGTDVDLWFRNTLCFQKTEGHWRIVHDHASVPFHMDGSFRAAVDLHPE